MNSKLWIVLGLALSFGVLAFGVKVTWDSVRPQGTDTDQVMRLLDIGERAAEARTPSQISQLLSSDYQDALGNNRDRMRYLIRDAVLRYRNLDVTLSHVDIRLDPGGQTAQVSFQVTFNGSGDGSSFVSSQLSLNLVKERVMHYWVFPAEEWRVKSAEGYGGLE